MSNIKRLTGAAIAVFLTAGLTACGDKAQELAGQPKVDAAPYTGTGVKAFTESDWKAGDKNSCAQQPKTRDQYGQNDQTRSN